MKKAKKWEMKNRLLGLCITCGKPAKSQVYCEYHLEKQRIKSRERREIYKAQGRCPRCGKPLHPEFNLKICLECNDRSIFKRHQSEGRY